MAGHSQFKNIMHRKGAQDAKRSKIFSMISREIATAVKLGGSDVEHNPRLRLAIQNSRAHNMPKDNINRAIRKGEGGDAESYDEIRYEGYGSGGVAVIVEALTDNRNRSASNIRACFAKHGGSLAETGAVSFMFDQVGEIVYPAEVGSGDDVLMAAIEAGAEDVVSDDKAHTVTCAFTDLSTVSKALEVALGAADSVKVIWRPQTTTELDEDKAQTILKLMNALEDDDDVQNVYANFEIPDEVMAKLAM